MFKLKNPSILFIIIWIFVLLLYSLNYSLILTQLQDRTIIYIILACIAFFSGTKFIRLVFLEKIFKPKLIFNENNNIRKNLKYFIIIWIIFSLVEILYFKGVPMTSILGITSGSDRYTEWGLPSLHGLLNAFLLTISNYFFFFFLKYKEKKYFYYFLICLIWPILLLTRQLLMSIVFDSVFIFILYNKIRLKTIIKVLFAGVLIILVFGWLGDIRTGDSFIELVSPSDNYPKWLPSGFLWVYIYVVSPINNINYNILNFQDFTFNLSPLLSNIFPSFIRDIFFSSANTGFQLVNDSLNVSSMFLVYLNSFGFYGSIIFYFFMGLILTYIYYKNVASSSSNKWFFILVVLLHNVCFSVFVDFFFNLVFLFQIFLHIIIESRFKLSE